MDKVAYYEWHGNALMLIALFVFGITIPLVVPYFLTNLVRFEMEVADATKFSEYLRKQKK